MKTATRFANALVELSDPYSIADFRSDPSTFIKKHELSLAEQDALVNRKSNHIRFFAKGISDRIPMGTPDTMPSVGGLALDVIDVIDVTSAAVVVAAQEHRLYIDKAGNAFTLEAIEGPGKSSPT